MLTERELMSSGPVLADGTRVADLIDINRREVSMRVLWDPGIYELELERLFARSWLVVGHESEIPEPGDFVVRYMGQDSVIVGRGSNGEINVMLNVCQHRGMQVCRADAGNASEFKCQYHGWIFGRDGSFVGAPIAREQMWGDVIPKSELGLPRARSATYVGMIFATWDEHAPPLEDFLGDMAWYLDLMFGRTDSGMQVLGKPQRFMMPANWKCPGEQHNSDGYHTLGLHRSLIDLGLFGTSPAPGMYGIDISAMGHGQRCIASDDAFTALVGSQRGAELSVREKLEMIPPPGMTHEMLSDLEHRLTPDQLRLLAEAPPQAGGLFPNVGVLNFYFPLPDGKMGSCTSWNVFLPKGPGRFELMHWALAEKGASPELRETTRRATLLALGASGIVEQDDAEAWPSMQRAAEGYVGRKQTLKYQALVGENKPDNWPGGGHVYEGFTKDDNQWEWWLRWRDFVVGEPW